MRAGFIGLGHMGARGDYDDSVALALACEDLGLPSTWPATSACPPRSALW